MSARQNIDERAEQGLTTAACPSQRWKLGRSYWRVDRDEGFRKCDYAVDSIRDSTARKFVVEHHYSGSFPIAMERVGLFCGSRLVGVAVFSIPINNSVIPRYTGQAAKHGAELGRFVLLDEVPYNAESYFLSQAFRVLRALRPEVASVVAYSDPMPRSTVSGQIVLPGHVGISYQAGNAQYLGRAASKTLHLTPSGLALSTRAISKVRLQEHGAQSAERLLVRLGAPPREFGQEPAVWINTVLAGNTFRKIRHPGNHVYAWPLGSASKKVELLKCFAVGKDFPKCLDETQADFGFESA